MFVRAMEPKDAEQAFEITREIMLDSWEKHEKDYYPRKAVDFDISTHSARDFRESLEGESYFTFIAEENGNVVGVASGRRFGESGLARLGWIGVHPSHQNRGIGRALLAKVISHCEGKGCHKVTLYTLPVLIPALNLYLKLGFVPESYLRREWWGVDFIKMSKWL